MVARLRSWWQKVSKHPVAAVIISLLVILIALIVLVVIGYKYNWVWTGLGPYNSPSHPKDSDYQRGKTLWDWLQLLIIPAVLAVGGYLFSYATRRSEQEANRQRAQTEREAAEKHAQTEREIAEDNQCEAALQAYIDKMAELLLEKHISESEQDEARKIARVRTLTVLSRLNSVRKRIVLQFLYEAGLILKGQPIIDLRGADLRGANVREGYLNKADLSKAYLEEANLEGPNVTFEQLEKAKSLTGATMPDGFLHP